MRRQLCRYRQGSVSATGAGGSLRSCSCYVQKKLIRSVSQHKEMWPRHLLLGTSTKCALPPSHVVHCYILHPSIHPSMLVACRSSCDSRDAEVSWGCPSFSAKPLALYALQFITCHVSQFKTARQSQAGFTVSDSATCSSLENAKLGGPSPRAAGRHNSAQESLLDVHEPCCHNKNEVVGV